jgi:hypothetical protein
MYEIIRKMRISIVLSPSSPARTRLVDASHRQLALDEFSFRSKSSVGLSLHTESREHTSTGHW